MRCEPLEDRCMLSITLNQIGTYETGIFDDSAAEIVAYDPVTQRVFVSNNADQAVDVLDISDPTNPTLDFSIDVSSFGDAPTSVAVHGNLVAVAIKADAGARGKAPLAGKTLAMIFQKNIRGDFL